MSIELLLVRIFNALADLFVCLFSLLYNTVTQMWRKEISNQFGMLLGQDFSSTGS